MLELPLISNDRADVNLLLTSRILRIFKPRRLHMEILQDFRFDLGIRRAPRQVEPGPALPAPPSSGPGRVAASTRSGGRFMVAGPLPGAERDDRDARVQSDPGRHSNRGLLQDDINLHGVRYLQQIPGRSRALPEREARRHSFRAGTLDRARPRPPIRRMRPRSPGWPIFRTAHRWWRKACALPVIITRRGLRRSASPRFRSRRRIAGPVSGNQSRNCHAIPHARTPIFPTSRKRW